jgi:hypothetical protein
MLAVPGPPLLLLPHLPAPSPSCSLPHQRSRPTSSASSSASYPALGCQKLSVFVPHACRLRVERAHLPHLTCSSHSTDTSTRHHRQAPSLAPPPPAVRPSSVQRESWTGSPGTRVSGCQGASRSQMAGGHLFAGVVPGPVLWREHNEPRVVANDSLEGHPPPRLDRQAILVFPHISYHHARRVIKPQLRQPERRAFDLPLS